MWLAPPGWGAWCPPCHSLATCSSSHISRPTPPGEILQLALCQGGKCDGGGGGAPHPGLRFRLDLALIERVWWRKRGCCSTHHGGLLLSILNVFLVLNALSQSLQLWGIFPVWTLPWFFNSVFTVNALPQLAHLCVWCLFILIFPGSGWQCFSSVERMPWFLVASQTFLVSEKFATMLTIWMVWYGCFEFWFFPTC